MTIAQVTLYAKSIQQIERDEYLNKMGMFRMAQHADEKQYKKYVRDLQRD